MIDLGGYRLHINSMGKGSPAVVLIAGAGDYSFDWSLVQSKIAKFARVHAYDRAGLAWSDLGPTPRTMRQEVYELHELLKRAGEKGPYVLVGHSMEACSRGYSRNNILRKPLV
jgi:pimeloyl-ACP methyl ester carboxylesterase